MRALVMEEPMAKANAQGPNGGLTPHLTVKGAKDAIKFYKKAFGASERMVMPAEDGKRLMHAHIEINGASLMLADDFPEFHGGRATPKPASVTMHLQVDDADKWWARALKAGAKVKFPIADQFWGDRYGQVADPFGHSWSIGAPIKNSKKPVAKAIAKAGGKPKKSGKPSGKKLRRKAA
jgi:PhnB protein